MPDADPPVRHILVALTECDPGYEEAHAEWYENHLRELVERTSCRAAQRFELADSGAGEAAPRLLAIYEFEGDLQAAMATVAAAKPGLTPKPAAIEGRIQIISVHTYTAITERIEAA